MVEWLARWFRNRNVRVALISRGYGAEKGSLNDEALELEQKLPDVPHLQNPDRVEAAQIAIEELETELILLDDAFQHRRIHRDLDIVLIDALEPFGYGHLLPRGLLREPLDGLRRADVFALTRADMVTPQRGAEIRTRVERFNPRAVWIEVSHAPQSLVSHSGATLPLESLRDKEVAAFCGIGNPAGFRHTLDACGCRVAWFNEFPDHHRFRREDIDQLAAKVKKADDLWGIVCTHKDLVKIALERLASTRLWALEIAMKLRQESQEFEEKLESVMKGSRGGAGAQSA
jgi:tetraacyldisaccharide 4'-kinase